MNESKQTRDGMLWPLTPEGGASHLMSKDVTGRFFASISLFESVEKWTLAISGNDSAGDTRIRVAMEDLQRMLEDYSREIPADNLQVVQLLTSLKMRTMLQVIDFLSRYQGDFFSQFIAYCKQSSSDDLLAFASVRRFIALMVSGWAERAFSASNAQYIVDVLGRDGVLTQ